MATVSDRLSNNIAGKYYVDSTCIDCDQCRVQAPDFFARDEDTGMSFVKRQPANDEETTLMEEALNSCATASIGNDGE